MDDANSAIQLLNLLKFITIRSRLLAYKAYKLNTQIWSSYEAEPCGKQRDIKNMNELFPLLSSKSIASSFVSISQKTGKCMHISYSVLSGIHV